MAGNLHEISRRIGVLEAQAEEGGRQRGEIFKELRSQTRDLGEIKAALEKLPDLVKRVESVEKSVAPLERMRQRGIGFLLAAGLGGGAAGASAVEWAGKLIRKLGGS